MLKPTIGYLLLAGLLLFSSCQKRPETTGSGTGSGSGSGSGSGGSSGGTNQPPVDPPTPGTIGFFLNDWAPRNFTAPSFTDTTIQPGATTATVSIDASNVVTRIPNSVFGQNINTWMTQVVTESSLMSNITNLHPGVIRFPGGSISDTYFWNLPNNAKPSDIPDSLLDANGNKTPTLYWYGKNTDNWTLSLDNYYSLLQQTGNQGIIIINYGYARYGTSANPVAAAAHLAADWVRYDNGRTKYWEIGNEDNGTWEAGYRIDVSRNKDNQPEIITGDLYGKHVTVFVDSMRKAAQEIGKTIYIGAQLLETQPAAWQTSTDKGWNTGVFGQAGNSPDFYIFHSYYTPYKENSTPEVILNSAVTNTTAMMTWYQGIVSSGGVTQKPLALTEWNINAEGSMQKVSYINGMHAAIMLGELLKNKYGEASRWDLANAWENGNDHGLFNIGDEPGVSKWNPRPAFFYMYYFKRLMGDRLVSASVSGATDVLGYATSFSSGQQAVELVNKGTSTQTVSLSYQNFTPGSRIYWYTLTGGTDNGAFSRQVFVNGKGPSEASGGPSDYTSIKAYSTTIQNGIRLTMPPRSVIFVQVDK